MQISISMGAKPKTCPREQYLVTDAMLYEQPPITIVTFANYVSNTNRGRWQPVWPSCEPKLLRAQKCPQTLRSNQRSEPGSKAYQYTCRGNRPTRYRRRPKGVVPNGARPPKRFGRPANLTAGSYGPSTVSKNFNINRAQKIRNY